MPEFRVHFLCGWGVEIVVSSVRALNSEAAAKNARERLECAFAQYRGYRFDGVTAIQVGV